MMFLEQAAQLSPFNMSDIFGSVQSAFSPDLSFIFNLAKTIGIVFLIYLIFLIVQAVIKTKQALRIKEIDKNVSEINRKIGELLALNKEKHEKEKSKK